VSRKLVLTILAILASGFVVALISGLYRQELSIPGRTNIGYGFPLSWHGESGTVVYPEMPTVGWFSWESFALDIAFWSMIIAIPVAVAFEKFKTRKQT